MAPILYQVPGSPPVRAVWLCAKALGVELDNRFCDLSKAEHLTEDYKKFNPASTVPTLVEEDGFCLWNSHAIMAYFSDKYGKDDSLYPKDLRKRAKVNEKLFFEDGIFFAKAFKLSRAIAFDGKNTITDEDRESLYGVYEKIERFLENSKYIAGDHLTIADFSYIITLVSYKVLIPIDESKYPKITAYIKRMEALPYFEECNKEGQEMFATLMTSNLIK